MRSIKPIVLVLGAVLGSGAAGSTCNRDATSPVPQTSESPPARREPVESAAADSAPASEAPDDRSLAEISDYCPMSMSGATVERIDTEDGVALVFTTNHPNDVEELRERARHLAQRYERHGSMGMHHGMGAINAQAPVPGAHTTVTDIEGGARVDFAPIDPSQRSALREHIRRHLQQMQTGTCPRLDDVPRPHRGPRHRPPPRGSAP